jgi:hypothetical protein
VAENYKLKREPVDREKVIDILVNQHDFSKERVENSLAKLEESTNKRQKGLGDFF